MCLAGVTTCNHESEYQCKDNTTCIEQAWVCDGETDCTDGDDELNCNACKGFLSSQLSILYSPGVVMQKLGLS
jgi:hypothetical protein